MKPEVGQVWEDSNGTRRRVEHVGDCYVQAYNIDEDFSFRWGLRSFRESVMFASTLITPSLPKVGERWRHNRTNEKYRVIRIGVDAHDIHIEWNNGTPGVLSGDEWKSWFANATRLEDKMTRWDELIERTKKADETCLQAGITKNEIAKEMSIDNGGVPIGSWYEHPSSKPMIEFVGGGRVVGKENILALRDSIDRMLGDGE